MAVLQKKKINYLPEVTTIYFVKKNQAGVSFFSTTFCIGSRDPGHCNTDKLVNLGSRNRRS